MLIVVFMRMESYFRDCTGIQAWASLETKVYKTFIRKCLETNLWNPNHAISDEVIILSANVMMMKKVVSHKVFNFGGSMK